MPPVPQPGANPGIFATTDGRIMTGIVRTYPLRFPRRQGIFTQIGSWTGGLLPSQIALLGLSLSPAGTVFAVNTIEYFPNGEDERIALFDTGGASLFFATDIAVPPQTWYGDDPDAPPDLLQVQANVDIDWQAALQQDPNLPRWILQAVFRANSAGDSLRVAGWNAAGELIVTGTAQLTLQSPDNVFPDFEVGPIAWWGRIAPDGAGQWRWADRGHGLPIGSNAPLAPPANAFPGLSINAAGDLVVAITQTNPELAGGLLAFDGPFS